jgi:peptidoglycan pentaglycine glycine transferase (the first glycine)
MPEVSLADWNKFMGAQPGAHLLQCGEWGELKSAFGWEAVRLMCGRAGAQILFRGLPFGFSLAYIPKLGVRAALPGAEFWQELDALCRRRRAIFLKIEPDAWNDEPLGAWNTQLQTSPFNIQPPRTLLVDLRGAEADILARMKQKCRYNIRLAAKKGVTVRAWDDLAAFHSLLQVTGGRDEFGVHSAAYYARAYELFHPSGTCELLVAEFEGRPLAAMMAFARGARAWYLYGASSDDDRNLMPTYLLQWEAMRWAKARGCEQYDLWGVPDEDQATLEAGFETRSDGLWGVYRFKRGFGGELKRAAQASDRVYNPLLYRLYVGRAAGQLRG